MQELGYNYRLTDFQAALGISQDVYKRQVPDGQMQRFIAVSGTYDDHLLYFQPDELNLSRCV